MREEEFTNKLLATVDAKFGEIMAQKSDPKEKFLNYVDVQTISGRVRNVFIREIGTVPNQIEVTLNMCEAIMSPSRVEKIKLLKKAAGLAGGVSGIAMILNGIGLALGWGASVVKSLIVIFTGTSISGPIAWIAGGVGVAAIAGYFAFSGSDPLKNTEKYMNALKEGLKKGMPAVWTNFSEKF